MSENVLKPYAEMTDEEKLERYNALSKAASKAVKSSINLDDDEKKINSSTPKIAMLPAHESIILVLNESCGDSICLIFSIIFISHLNFFTPRRVLSA